MITPRERIAWLIRELQSLDYGLESGGHYGDQEARYLATITQELHLLQIDLVPHELIERTAADIVSNGVRYINPVEVH